MDNQLIDTSANIFLGLIATPIVSLVTTQNMRSEYKVLISIAISFALGLLSSFIAGTLNVADVASSTSTVFATATTFYKLYFEHTVTNTKLHNIGHRKTDAKHHNTNTDTDTDLGTYVNAFDYKNENKDAVHNVDTHGILEKPQQYIHVNEQSTESLDREINDLRKVKQHR